MTFTIPSSATGASLFREPMVLFKPGNQISSTSTGITAANTGLSASAAANYISGGGFLSAVTDPANVGDNSTQAYIGFYEGAFPLRWVTGTGAYNSSTNTNGEQVIPCATMRFPGRLQSKSVCNIRTRAIPATGLPMTRSTTDKRHLMHLHLVTKSLVKRRVHS